MPGGRLCLGGAPADRNMPVSHGEFLCPSNLVSKYFNASSIDHAPDI